MHIHVLAGLQDKIGLVNKRGEGAEEARFKINKDYGEARYVEMDPLQV